MKSDEYRLARISEIGRKLLRVVDVRGITEERLQADFELQWLVSTPLYNIGEQVNCLSREFCDLHAEVPWSQVAGLRHRLVHDYEGTSWTMVARVLINDLGPFLDQVDAILRDLH